MKTIIVNTIIFLVGIVAILCWGCYSSALDAGETAMFLGFFFMLGYFIVILVLFLYKLIFSKNKQNVKWLGFTLISFVLCLIILNTVLSIFFPFEYFPMPWSNL